LETGRKRENVEVRELIEKLEEIENDNLEIRRYCEGEYFSISLVKIKDNYYGGRIVTLD